jgi:GTPase
MDPEAPASAPARLPRVAVVGRQNVGKSTLLNRFLGQREAIAHETPGVTRDRMEVPIEWRGRRFLVVDTGGYIRRATGVETLVAQQVERALEQADVILLVVDAVTGPQDEDADLARRLRRADAPVVLVANKVDSETQEPGALELYRLGLGEPLPVSAIHGRGSGDLLDRIVELLPEPTGDEDADLAGEAAFAIVGRPNVGKSSLFNRLVGEERAVVSEIAGTTRDAVDSLVTWDGRLLRFVDTAGFRKPSRAETLEYYGYVRAVRAIDRSHVVCMVIDASEGVTTEDRKIASRVEEAGRGLVVIANKWDLVEEKAKRFVEVRERVEVFPKVPVLRTSAVTGAGVGRVVPALLEVHAQWTQRVGTSEVNRVLGKAQDEHPPPRAAGRLLYGTQVAAGPPRFVIFTGGQVPLGYRRYLEHRFRDAFGFEGVPIRLSFRSRRTRDRRR